MKNSLFDLLKTIIVSATLLAVLYIFYLCFDSYNKQNTLAVSTCMENNGQWIKNDCVKVIVNG